MALIARTLALKFYFSLTVRTEFPKLQINFLLTPLTGVGGLVESEVLICGKDVGSNCPDSRGMGLVDIISFIDGPKESWGHLSIRNKSDFDGAHLIDSIDRRACFKSFLFKVI